MTLLFGNFPSHQKAMDAEGEIVKRTHWHIVHNNHPQQEPFYSLSRAINTARAKYPTEREQKHVSFTERRTNHCEICQSSGGRDTIKKTSKGYKVLSESGGKSLGGPYKSKKQAEKRLRQVEYFKHQPNS